MDVNSAFFGVFMSSRGVVNEKLYVELNGPKSHNFEQNMLREDAFFDTTPNFAKSKRQADYAAVSYRQRAYDLMAKKRYFRYISGGIQAPKQGYYVLQNLFVKDIKRWLAGSTRSYQA